MARLGAPVEIIAQPVYVWLFGIARQVASVPPWLCSASCSNRCGASLRLTVLLSVFVPFCWLTLRMGLDQNDRKALGGFARRMRLV